ncbi:hypothetical protein ACFX13_032700 [Malus domestica]
MTSLNHDDFADTDDIPVTSLQGILHGRKNPDYEKQCNDWTENFGDVSSWTGPSKTNFSQGTLKKKRLP